MQIEHVEIAKLELHRGDLLLVRVPPDWSDKQQTDAHEAIKRAMHLADANVPIIIGTTDIDIQIVRKADRDAA